MPEMDGFEFLSQYRQSQHGPCAPIMVACTAFDSDRDRADSLSRGFDHHISKPVSLDTLRHVLSRQGSVESGAPDVDVTPRSSVDIGNILLQKLGGNKKLAQTILTLMREQCPLFAEKLAQSAVAEDVSALQEILHTLKGQLGYFGQEHPVCEELLAITREFRTSDTLPVQRLLEFSEQLRHLGVQIEAELVRAAELPQQN